MCYRPVPSRWHPSPGPYTCTDPDSQNTFWGLVQTLYVFWAGSFLLFIAQFEKGRTFDNRQGILWWVNRFRKFLRFCNLLPHSPSHNPLNRGSCALTGRFYYKCCSGSSLHRSLRVGAARYQSSYTAVYEPWVDSLPLRKGYLNGQ